MSDDLHSRAAAFLEHWTTQHERLKEARDLVRDLLAERERLQGELKDADEACLEAQEERDALSERLQGELKDADEACLEAQEERDALSERLEKYEPIRRPNKNAVNDDLHSRAAAFLETAEVDAHCDEYRRGGDEIGPNDLAYYRNCIAAFGRLMLAKLVANHHKRGWDGDPPDELADRVKEEAQELRDAVDTWESGFGVVRGVGLEAADVANMAMMVADVCGQLPSPPQLNAARALVRELLTDRKRLQQVQRQWLKACDTAQGVVQRYSLGLGGESVFDLVCKEIDQLRAKLEAERKKAGDARRVLDSIIGAAEDGCFGELFEECTPDCPCVICDARRELTQDQRETPA